MNESYLLIVVLLVAAFALVAVILALMSLLNTRKLLKFFKDKQTRADVLNIVEALKQNKTEFDSIKQQIDKVNKRQNKALQAIGIEHFDPFAGSGNTRLSFALAIVSSEGDGVIISTIHSQNAVSVFAKEVKNFEPTRKASQEERYALEKAINSLHNKQ